ncbi:MAG: PhzF family phenazine biosynthesis protein [Gordonia sp. (in: high G+C Gram-positive bacteria)]
MDVFGGGAEGFGTTGGNPVAVVLDADGLDDDAMARFARWTNLSETTFVLPPTDPAADYRLRIFTPGGELPFAGHPTLGSAHAWLAARDEAGTTPSGALVQECGIGAVRIGYDDAGRFAFAAPPLTRSGPPDAATLDRVRTAFGLAPDDVVAAEWVSNGPPWLALMLDDGRRVLEATPDTTALGPDDFVGLVGPWPDRADAHYEVRAFVPGMGVPEDPVTGSLNAGIAVWLRRGAAGPGLRAPSSYVAAQGTAIGRAGRVFVDDDGDDVWIGGACTTVISGTVDL